jgi:hypothetical protein
MTSGQGWTGRMGQVTYYLSIVGADRDPDGKFLIEGGIYSFLGLVGNNVDVVVEANTRYFVNSHPASLVLGLRGTSYGMGVYVIA